MYQEESNLIHGKCNCILMMEALWHVVIRIKKQVLVAEKCEGCQTLVREISRCTWKEISLGYEDFIKNCESYEERIGFWQRCLGGGRPFNREFPQLYIYAVALM